MNIATIAGIVVTLTLLFGAGLGWIMTSASQLVNEKDKSLEKEKGVYSPATTKGFKIPVKEDFDTQIKTARQLAAKRAAALPRGANMRITGDSSNIATAFQATDSDPLTATKIAEFHSWQGVATGMTSGAVAGAAPGAVTGSAPTRSIKDLKPGVDYEYTDYSNMKGAEKRRTIIANAKAKSAAIKALKAGGGFAEGAAPVPTAVGTAQPAAQPTATPAVPVATGGTVTRKLIPGQDYPVIEITDDMAPAEKRKAKISNSKAKSAAMKALKASGALEVAAPAPAPVATPVAAAPAPAVAATAPATTAPANVPPAPDYTEITDDMAPADKRKAKINNSKMRSAYNKELKALGIDPKSLK